jgi:hypothetical protein
MKVRLHPGPYILRFLRPHDVYNAGDKANFDLKAARWLLDYDLNKESHGRDEHGKRIRLPVAVVDEKFDTQLPTDKPAKPATDKSEYVRKVAAKKAPAPTRRRRSRPKKSQS